MALDTESLALVLYKALSQPFTMALEGLVGPCPTEARVTVQVTLLDSVW
jgi:hypothetical protein